MIARPASMLTRNPWSSIVASVATVILCVMIVGEGLPSRRRVRYLTREARPFMERVLEALERDPPGSLSELESNLKLIVAAEPRAVGVAIDLERAHYYLGDESIGRAQTLDAERLSLGWCDAWRQRVERWSRVEGGSLTPAEPIVIERLTRQVRIGAPGEHGPITAVEVLWRGPW